MLKINVNYNVNNNVNDCIQNIVKDIKNITDLKLTMVFKDQNTNISEFINTYKNTIGNKQIIGCTTKGIMTNEGTFDTTPFIGTYNFIDEKTVVGVASTEDISSPRDAGKKLARTAIENAGIKKVPAFFYMISSQGNEEEYLKGIEDVIGTVPFFGNTTAGEIICNNKIINKGCAVAFFYSKIEIKNIYSGEYNETSNAGVITKISDDNKLLEIDREPAFKKYAKWNNIKSKEDLENKKSLYPLGVKDPIGSVTRVMNILDNDKDIMVLSNKLALGTAVMQLQTTVEEIIKSNENLIMTLNSKMKNNISGYFLIESADRINILKDKKIDLHKTIKNCTNDKEFLLIFSDGEFGSCDHSASTCGALSMSFTTFSE